MLCAGAMWHAGTEAQERANCNVLCVAAFWHAGGTEAQSEQIVVCAGAVYVARRRHWSTRANKMLCVKCCGDGQTDTLVVSEKSECKIELGRVAHIPACASCGQIFRVQ